MDVFPTRAVFLAAYSTASVGLMLSLVGDLLAEPLHRPMEEMRGGCADYATDVRAELAAMDQASRSFESLADRNHLEPIMPESRPITLTLLHAERIEHAAMPKHRGPFAGLLPVTVPRHGRYRISVNTASWIEVVAGQERLEPLAFEMQTGCGKLFKTLDYALQAGRRY